LARLPRDGREPFAAELEGEDLGVPPPREADAFWAPPDLAGELTERPEELGAGDEGLNMERTAPDR